MSIATLKKKSGATQFARISAGSPFSLNSSRRLEGHHQEPQYQSLFRGTGARGTGIPDDVRVRNQSQRVNYDPYDTQRPSIKSNQALISKLMWPKPVVKSIASKNYDIYYKTLADNCAVSNTGGTCNTGYAKKVGPQSYEEYNQTTLLDNNCITSANIHLPVAGNGLQSARSC
jgi:hypothetical protein